MLASSAAATTTMPITRRFVSPPRATISAMIAGVISTRPSAAAILWVRNAAAMPAAANPMRTGVGDCNARNANHTNARPMVMPTPFLTNSMLR